MNQPRQLTPSLTEKCLPTLGNTSVLPEAVGSVVDGGYPMDIPCSRWVYIFGMENEGDFFSGLLGDTEMGDFWSSGLYKIGTTVNPVRRWQQVQVHSPWDLRVFAVFPGGFEIEKAIHKHLDEHRIRGEWFSMSRMTMYEVLNELEDRLSIGQQMFSDLPWSSITYIGEAE